jgi:hypothetical protein
MDEVEGRISRGRGPKIERCLSCGDGYTAHVRVRGRQKTCGKRECVLKHRARYRRAYRRNNIEEEKGYQAKCKAGRAKGYWREYRRRNPQGAARNRAGAKLRRELCKAELQRQLDIVQVFEPKERLEQIVVFATSHRSLLFECRGKRAA